MKKIFSLIILMTVIAMSLLSCGKVEKSYEKLDEYIVSNATAQNGIHELVIGMSSSGNTSYTRIARRTENQIELELRVSSGEMLRSFVLVLGKANLDIFNWSYSSAVSGGSMSGVITPNEYKRSITTLGYTAVRVGDKSASDYYASSDYDVASMSTQAKDMCNCLLESLASDLAAIKLSAEDFGFKDYKD